MSFVLAFGETRIVIGPLDHRKELMEVSYLLRETRIQLCFFLLLAKGYIDVCFKWGVDKNKWFVVNIYAESHHHHQHTNSNIATP